MQSSITTVSGLGNHEESGNPLLKYWIIASSRSEKRAPNWKRKNSAVLQRATERKSAIFLAKNRWARRKSEVASMIVLY